MEPAVTRFGGALSAAIALLIALSVPTVSSPGEEPLLGRWEGAIIVRPAELEVGLAIEFQRQGGELRGTIAFPTQSADVHALAQVDAQGSVAQWIYKDPSGDPSFFNGVISAAGGELAGTVQDGGKTLRFVLRRVASVAPRPVVTRLSADGRELRSRFDRDAGDVRLLMILSPTCTYCRSNARMVQSYVLDRIKNSHVKVYVVWERINPHDSEAESRELAALMADARASHFWAENQFAGNAFRSGAGGDASPPPWDVLLAFAPNERWVERAPAPRFSMYGARSGELPEGKPFNAARLAAQVGELLELGPMP